MQLLHRPAANKASQLQSSRRQALALSHSAIAMASLLSSVSGASSHLSRATLGPVAQRNVSFNESTVASIASSSGRFSQGAACLASSASCQTFGSSELVSWKSSSLGSRKQARRAYTVRIRCEGTTEGGNTRSLDTWIGRFAMLGFVAAIGVEISTGKGVLASAGLPLPAPALVLALIALAGAVTAFGVFRSTDRD